MSERTKVTHCVKGHPAGWCDCRVFKPAPPGAFAEPSDPRPAAVSAPAGEATGTKLRSRCDCGAALLYDELHEGNVCSECGTMYPKGARVDCECDGVGMCSDHIARMLEAHPLPEGFVSRSPSPASGAPDEDELMAALRSDRLPLSQGQCERIADLIDALRTRLAASERAGVALREALTFYATQANWFSPSKGLALQYDPEPSPIARDSGAKARAALSPTSPTAPPRERESEVIRLPSSIGMGRCIVCGATCQAGYSHFPPEDGMCLECAKEEFERD